MKNTNDAAIKALSLGDKYDAQVLFRMNSQKHASHITLNNLGVFYATQGIVSKNGKTKKGYVKGLKLLQKAHQVGQTYENNVAIGKVEFCLNNYESACTYFSNAIELKRSVTCLFNLGLSFMKLKEYRKAANCFLTIINEKQELIPINDVLIPYAFCLLHYRRKESINVLRILLNKHTDFDLMDIFVLAFYCEEWDAALELCNDLVCKWCLDIEVLSMVIECMVRSQKVSIAKEYLQDQIELRNESEHRPLFTIGIMKMLSLRCVRKYLIRKYKVNFQLLDDNYYLLTNNTDYL